MMRRAAAVYLDIQDYELKAGIRSQEHPALELSHSSRYSFATRSRTAPDTQLISAQPPISKIFSR